MPDIMAQIQICDSAHTHTQLKMEYKNNRNKNNKRLVKKTS